MNEQRKAVEDGAVVSNSTLVPVNRVPNEMTFRTSSDSDWHYKILDSCVTHMYAQCSTGDIEQFDFNELVEPFLELRGMEAVEVFQRKREEKALSFKAAMGVSPTGNRVRAETLKPGDKIKLDSGLGSVWTVVEPQTAHPDKVCARSQMCVTLLLPGSLVMLVDPSEESPEPEEQRVKAFSKKLTDLRDGMVFRFADDEEKDLYAVTPVNTGCSYTRNCLCLTGSRRGWMVSAFSDEKVMVVEVG